MAPRLDIVQGYSRDSTRVGRNFLCEVSRSGFSNDTFRTALSPPGVSYPASRRRSFSAFWADTGRKALESKSAEVQHPPGHKSVLARLDSHPRVYGMSDPKRFKVQSKIAGENESSLRRYQDLVIGSRRWKDLILYEGIQLLAAWVPGALGLVLRKNLYPLILGKCGRGVVFGRDVVLRHPRKIRLGDGVIIDDGVMLDAKGTEQSGIELGDGVFVGRGSILSCKGGTIRLGARSNIGFHSEIFSSNKVEVGADVMIAAYVYILGGGTYRTDRTDIPMNQQYDFEGKGGVEIGDDVWIAAHAVIFDGVRVGSGAVVGASAVVNRDVPSKTISVGIPARSVGLR